ncbi:MAG: ATP-binding protein [Bacteroidota bacterium]
MIKIKLKVFLTAFTIIVATSCWCNAALGITESPIQPVLDSVSAKEYKSERIRLLKRVISHYDSVDQKLTIPYLQQLIRFYESEDEMLNAADGYSQLVRVFYSFNAYDSIIFYAKKADSLYLKLGTEIAAIPVRHEMARAYNSKTDFSKALESHKQILEFYNNQPDDFPNKLRRIANQKINIALAWYEMGFYEFATNYTVESLKLIDSHKHWGVALKCYALKVMGMISLKEGDYQEALQHFTEAKQIIESSTDKRLPQKYKITEYISQTYFAMKKYDVALDYILQTHTEASLKGKSKDAGIALNYAGEIYLELKDYQQADEYFSNALQVFETGSTHKYIAITKLNIAKSLIARDKTNDLISSLLHEAIKESEIAKSKAVTRDCYYVLADYHFQLNQPSKAYEFSRLYNVLSDSILNESKAKRIGELKIDYEIEREVIERKYEFEKQLIEANYQQEKETILYITLIVILLILVLIFFIWKEGEKAKRKASELSHKIKEESNKHKIEQLIKDQEIDKIRANLAGQEKERKRIAKELHDGVGGSLAAIKILIQKADSGYHSMFSKASSRLDEVCEEVRTISHHLTPPFLYNISFIDVVEQFALDIANTHQLNVAVKCFEKDVINEFDNELKTDIYRMVQELTHNAVKHAKASNITIQLGTDEQYFSLMVEDDGIGVSNLKESKGIGLSNLELRVSSLGGTLDIDSAIGEGTLVSIHIKLIPTIINAKHG